MSMDQAKIRKLDASSANQIRTCQTILDLQSVAKELIENAVDSGATNLELRLVNYGFDEICMIDDGSGIEEEDFQNICKKDYTSKIQSIDEIYCGLTTFGFRGEALNALCTICGGLSIITRHKGVSIGSSLEYTADGQLQSQKPIARPVGTTIVVKNLFLTQPVRRKHLEMNLKREYGKLMRLIEVYAVGAHLYAYKLIVSNIPTSSSSRLIVIQANGQSKNQLENVSTVFDAKLATSLIELVDQPISDEERDKWLELQKNFPDIRIESGLVSSIDTSMNVGPAKQFIFINKRPCEYKPITQTVNEIYRMQTKTSNPFLLLNLLVGDGEIDVNRVPNKRQIYLKSESYVLEKVKASVSNALRQYNTTMSLAEVNQKPINTNNKKILPNEERRIKRSCDKNSINQVPKARRLYDFNFELFDMVKQTTNNKNVSSSSNETSNQNELNTTTETSKNIKIEPSFTQMINPALRPSTLPEMHTLMTPLAEVTVIPNSTDKLQNQPLPANENTDPKAYIHAFLNTDKPTFKIKTPIKVKTWQQIDQSNNEKQISSQMDLSQSMTDFVDEPSQVTAESELRRRLSNCNNFRRMKIIGQYNHAFIITYLNRHLFVIDQHASDEKYLYEKFQQTSSFKSQPLIHCKQLDWSPLRLSHLKANAAHLRKMGYAFDFLENGTVLLTSVPTLYNTTFDLSDLDETLSQLEEHPTIESLPKKHNYILATRACHSAVRIGDSLNRDEMRSIVDRMATLKAPWNCPHGRPTIRHLKRLF